MSALLTPPRTALVTVAGRTVNLVVRGDPEHPRLLLLHGGMAHARWWDLVAARLADRLHVVAVDMPGHGESPWIDPRHYGHRNEVSIVQALLERLGPDRTTLGGHSHGALVATLVVTSEGLRPASIVLVDMPADPLAPRLVRSGAAFRRFPQPRWPTEEQAIAAFRLFPGDGAPDPGTLAYLGAHSIRPNGEGAWTSRFDWRYFRERPPGGPNPFVDFPERLARIPVPVLVLRGARSTIQPAEDHARLLARIPQARGAVVADAGHNPHVERPDETAAAIARFVLGT